MSRANPHPPVYDFAGDKSAISPITSHELRRRARERAKPLAAHHLIQVANCAARTRNRALAATVKASSPTSGNVTLGLLST